jgi:hypothetical protein
MTLNGFEALFIRLDWTNVFAFWKAIIKFFCHLLYYRALAAANS